ncbi:hypothetical protein BaRGS_00034385 [Batillaria attramentaria]|uniref:Uncharacterized protein n=1 Tax=Batillaria attramentaria TaxID=370345 RepID=A0ABD0JH78_9CAEN
MCVHADVSRGCVTGYGSGDGIDDFHMTDLLQAFSSEILYCGSLRSSYLARCQHGKAAWRKNKKIKRESVVIAKLGGRHIKESDTYVISNDIAIDVESLLKVSRRQTPRSCLSGVISENVQRHLVVILMPVNPFLLPEGSSQRDCDLFLVLTFLGVLSARFPERLLG